MSTKIKKDIKEIITRETSKEFRDPEITIRQLDVNDKVRGVVANICAIENDINILNHKRTRWMNSSNIYFVGSMIGLLVVLILFILAIVGITDIHMSILVLITSLIGMLSLISLSMAPEKWKQSIANKISKGNESIKQITTDNKELIHDNKKMFDNFKEKLRKNNSQ